MGTDPELVLVKLAGTEPPVVILRGRVPPSLNVCPCPVIVKCAMGGVCALVVLNDRIDPGVVP
jgi:hypothetical protein